MLKAGRNDPCPCGSGKKFKQCCLGKPSGAATQTQPQAQARSPQQLLQLAMGHHQAGRLKEAETGYRQLLQTAPGHPQLLFNLGLVLRAMGSLDEASGCLRKAIKAEPGIAEFHLALGNILKDQGKTDEAAAGCLKALELKPDFVEAHNNLGTVRCLQGRPDEAIDCYRAALSFRPSFTDAHINLGNLLRDQGRIEEAASAYRTALNLKPDLPEIHHKLGTILHRQGFIVDAIDAYHKALSRNPEDIDLLNSLATALRDQGRFKESCDISRKAVSVRPDSSESHYNLAAALEKSWRLHEAVDSYRESLRLSPGSSEAEFRLGSTLAKLGTIDQALACIEKVQAAKPSDLSLSIAHIFLQQYHPAVTNTKLFGDARSIGRAMEEQFKLFWCLPGTMTRPAGKIKLGFVSGDLRTHPVGFFLESVLQHLDREKFFLAAYANQTDFDDVSRRLWPCFDQWTRCNELNDDQLASRIMADGVTILIDLSGHTYGNRLGVFARKPAPIQVTWLGYANTTGLTAIDYILADAVTIPPDEECFYTEAVWRLPETYICFTPPMAAPPASPLPALTDSIITFGSPHNPAKINDRVVTLWAKVLQEVPGSLLLSKHAVYDHETAQQDLCQRFQMHGIPSDRLRFEGKSSRQEYLGFYSRIDCVLDPFPIPGLTTTCEALWMGVPTLTLALPHGLYGHNGELVMKSIGLPGWVAESEDDYVAKAKALTGDIGGLAELRSQLRQHLLDSPVCAAEMFAGNLEAAFQGMVARHFGEIPPDKIETRDKPTVGIISATRLSESEFWSSSPLGCSLRRLNRDSRLIPGISYDNSRGLPELYNKQIVAPDTPDILVFIHDDVWIDDPAFVDRILEECDTFDIIGVAGNRRRLAGQPSWAFQDTSFRWDDKEQLSGRIGHGPHPCGKVTEYGEAPAACELLDGLFLAARRKVLLDNGICFDPRFDFHFYDLDFCRTAREKGLRLGTWDVKLTHGSRGPVGGPEWAVNYQRYREKWGE